MSFFFFFNDTATTEIYTLSLHDALPICADGRGDPGGLRRRWADAADARAYFAGAPGGGALHRGVSEQGRHGGRQGDRKSTRLNSSHLVISYAVFCLKKKKNNTQAG